MFNYLKNFLFVSFIILMPYMNLSSKAMDDERTSITHKVAVKLEKPRPEAWKDASGNPAPPNVRRAADNLWDAVEREGEAAWNAGWGKKKVPSYCNQDDGCCSSNGIPCCCRVFCCLPLCGILECLVCIERSSIPGSNDEFVYYPYSVQFSAQKMVLNQKEQEMQTALNNFKEAVNHSVLQPEQYSGDADVCKIGAWVSNESVFCSGGSSFSGIIYYRGIRDLSGIPQSTMEFVNKHGGWNTKADKPLILKTEMRGNTLHVDF